MTNNLQNKQETQEIDLLKLLKVLWSKIWIIVAAAFVCGVLFFVYTFFFITPLYKSSALLYVNNSSLDIGSTKVNITSGDINASSSLIEVSGSSEGNTPVFKITVTDENPEMAANICNRIVEIMIDPNSGISGIVEGSSVSVIDYAVVSRSAFFSRIRPSFSSSLMVISPRRPQSRINDMTSPSLVMPSMMTPTSALVMPVGVTSIHAR